MKRLTIPILVSAVLATLISPGGAVLASTTLNWGAEVNLKECGPGPLVINVTEHVVKSLDSGLASWWAYDDYHRHIQVRETGPNTFCAVVRYEGDFTTTGGPSPAGVGTVAPGVSGPFQGGYRAIITGSLMSSPTWPTRGWVGATDYACAWADDGDNIFEYGEESCPGRIDWTAQYFSVTSFSFEWWGWIYRGGANGTWVNACTGPDPDCPGNSGDITD